MLRDEFWNLNFCHLGNNKPKKPYPGPLSFSCISTYGLHEFGIFVQKLPNTMQAADVKDFFSTWGTVVGCEVLKSNNSGRYRRAIVDFRPPPLTLHFMDQNLQPLHLGVRGEVLLIDFTIKTANRLNLREKGEYTKSQVQFEAFFFEMGLFLSNNKFLSAWKPSDRSMLEVNYARRIMFIKFHHKHDEYRIGIKFNDIHKRIVLDESDANTYVLYIQQSCPPFLWRRQEFLARSIGTLVSWNEENSWQRIPYIIDQNLKENVGQDARISIGNYLAYRISVPLTNACGELFKDSIDDLMRYNLVSNEVNVLLPIVIDMSKQKMIDIHSLLPFKLSYLVECLICAQKLSLYSLSEEWIAYMNSLDRDIANNILIRMMEADDLIEDPMTYSQRVILDLSNNLIRLKETSAHNMWIRRAIVTPSKIYLLLPTLELSNRVLRHFHQQQDYFIRVTFSDEHFEKLGTNRLLYQPIFDRIGEILREGFYIAKRHYRFLAFSSSQLREHSCWFFADTPDGIDVDFIREWMGDFSEIKNIAKHAARMGQCFSSTRAVKNLSKEHISEIPDIIRNGYVFSDGIGRISASLAAEIANVYNRKVIPGAFQIRLGGYKGVLAVSPETEMNGRLVQLRPSQRKFNSEHRALEIIRTAEFMPAYMNRQVIILLTTLGVPDKVFVDMQEEFLQEMDEIINDEVLALKFLALHYNSSWISGILKRMIQAGFLKSGDNITKSLLCLFRVQILRDVKERARIPIEMGAHLMGVLDETHTVRENQISVRFSDPKNPSAIRNYIGPAIVVRNPCLHPGDIHMVEAVDCPQLHSLVNCIVFSAQGSRDLPSQCAGGDLDGDTYMVLWDQRLFPSQKRRSSNYSKQENTSTRAITIEDTVEFFINYIISDNLGEIANAHLAWADQSEFSASSTECMMLSHLHTKAVDFVKTGIPAELEFCLRPKIWPDFMEKPPRKSYPSVRALGSMYRNGAMKLHGKSKYSPTTNLKEIQFNESLIISGYEAYVIEARRLKHEYDINIKDIMNQFGIESEAEAISGYIQSFPPMVNRKKERYALKETLSNIANEIWKVFRKQFELEFSKAAVKDKHIHTETMLNRKRKASAWYYVTYHPDEIKLQTNRYYWGVDTEDSPAIPHTADSTCLQNQEKPILLSFPWIVHDILCQILEDVTTPYSTM